MRVEGSEAGRMGSKCEMMHYCTGHCSQQALKLVIWQVHLLTHSDIFVQAVLKIVRIVHWKEGKGFYLFTSRVLSISLWLKLAP